MKIFITGGTGFIGSRLVGKLAGTDHRLTCLVRKNSDHSAVKASGADLVYGDVTEPESFRTALKGHDCLINLANVYSFWEPDPTVYRRVNIDGTRYLLEAALEAGLPKIIHISTGGVYGKPREVPFTEESDPGPRQFSEYFRTKYESDLIAWDLHKNRDLPLVMVYPMAVLGPGDPKATGQYIMRILKRRLPARILEDCVFTFVHVDDVADIIVKAALKDDNIGEKYLAGKFVHTFGEINRMVSEISGVSLPRLSLPDFFVMPMAWLMTRIADIVKRPPSLGMAIDQMRVMMKGAQADGSKAERELGIEYTPIRQAVQDAIASFTG